MRVAMSWNNSFSQRVFLLCLALSVLPAVSLPSAKLRIAEAATGKKVVDVGGMAMKFNRAMKARCCDMCWQHGSTLHGEEMGSGRRYHGLRLRGAGEEGNKSSPPFFFGGTGRLNSKQVSCSARRMFSRDMTCLKDLAQRLPSISAFNRTSDDASVTIRGVLYTCSSVSLVVLFLQASVCWLLAVTDSVAEPSQPEVKKKKHTKSFPVRHRFLCLSLSASTATSITTPSINSLASI